MDDITSQLLESIETKRMLLSENLEIIRDIGNTLIGALRQHNYIYLIGNGGSAADAQHIAGELMGRFQKNRQPLPAVALTTDSSVMTAIANDFGYDMCFVRQIEALVRTGDVILAFSTSGNSQGIIHAVQSAKTIGAITIGFTGKDGGQLQNAVDICLKIPSNNTPRIQECHITVGHILCSLIEKGLFGV
ncbi:MAG: SIS domain-containing protein [wastewater metagenome]|nr:SIS domain-containing protein [Candidatus Loosdrechtia aerotolerans]